MKAVIEAVDDAYVIRIYEREGALSDIYVVEELEVSGVYLNRTSEFRSNVPELAACRIV